jgi:hypothetical protein
LRLVNKLNISEDCYLEYFSNSYKVVVVKEDKGL